MFAFVILHYKNIEDTLKCIESIVELPEKNKKILVVDNNTLKEEEKKILKEKTDKLICLEENKGFAKANNLGCQESIKLWKPEYLIVINNDTEIQDKNFLKEIKKCNQKYHFDILGPKIISPLNSGSVNPYRPMKTKKEVEDNLKYQEKLLKYYQNYFGYFLVKTYVNIKRIFKKTRKLENGLNEEINVALHGCALIFSKQYYERFQDIFYPNTFLYYEEEFLYQRVVKQNVKSVYSPNLEIIHKEGKSLNITYQKERERLLFRTKEMIKSLKLLEKEME